MSYFFIGFTLFSLFLIGFFGVFLFVWTRLGKEIEEYRVKFGTLDELLYFEVLECLQQAKSATLAGEVATVFPWSWVSQGRSDTGVFRDIELQNNGVKKGVIQIRHGQSTLLLQDGKMGAQFRMANVASKDIAQMMQKFSCPNEL